MIHTVNNEIKESNWLQNRLKNTVFLGKMLFSPSQYLPTILFTNICELIIIMFVGSAGMLKMLNQN